MADKWEYCVLPIIDDARCDQMQDVLNQWGSEGWELIQVRNGGRDRDGIVYTILWLKREQK